MQHLEVSGAVRPLYRSLGFKRLKRNSELIRPIVRLSYVGYKTFNGHPLCLHTLSMYYSHSICRDKAINNIERKAELQATCKPVT